MTEIFPIDDARAFTGNGRRDGVHRTKSDRCRTIAITLVSPILSHIVTNKRHLVKIVLPIHEQVWNNRLRRTGLFQNWGVSPWNKYKNQQINGDAA